MKNRILPSLVARFGVLPILLASAFVLDAPAAPAAAKKGKAPDTGWVSLFNGKDLTGWVKVGEESWVVENGTIHGKGITKNYGYLRTEKKYRDFQLAIRFKCEADGNSGVFFRAEFQPDSVRLAHGLQF